MKRNRVSSRINHKRNGIPIKNNSRRRLTTKRKKVYPWFKAILLTIIGVLLLLGLIAQGKHIYDHITGKAHKNEMVKHKRKYQL